MTGLEKIEGGGHNSLFYLAAQMSCDLLSVTKYSALAINYPHGALP